MNLIPQNCVIDYYCNENFGFSDIFLRMTFKAKEAAIEEGGQKGGAIGALTKRQKKLLNLLLQIHL